MTSPMHELSSSRPSSAGPRPGSAGLGHAWRLALAFLMIHAALHARASAQFTSGSNGEDGPLNLAGSSGFVVFDPVARGIDDQGDNIFHFTTINIPAGVTLRLTVERMPNSPVFWLATGAVTIDGNIDISGGDGHAGGFGAVRVPSVPGPGGFAGGIAFGPPSGGCTQGSGPGSPNCCNNAASHVNAIVFACNNASRTYGNPFLQPMVGGSGGSGSSGNGFQSGGGGAGGGALVVASSLSIAANGQIDASGGDGKGDDNSTLGGAGSGGAVRLVAPAVTGTGSISVAGGSGRGTVGSVGRIRVEALNYAFTGSFNSGASVRVVRLTDSTVTAPTQLPSQLRVVSIGGVDAPLQPTGLFSPPDVTINSAVPVDVVVEATSIPPGTVVGITVYNESVGLMSASTGPLTGTLNQSIAMGTIDIPAGFSGVTVEANWTP